jgi:hypothetical protein
MNRTMRMGARRKRRGAEYTILLTAKMQSAIKA